MSVEAQKSLDELKKKVVELSEKVLSDQSDEWATKYLEQIAILFYP